MINGPPAKPSFNGTGMCGIVNGKLPKRMPTIMPIKMVAIFGVFRRFSELPISSATRLTFSSGPTTIMRSPTLKWWLRLAKRSIPWRLMRVTFTPYTELKCILASVLPFIALLVMIIRLLTIFLGWSSSCQSTSISGPMNAWIAFASTSAETMITSSSNSRIVSRVGTEITPFFIIRVQTMSRLRNSEISCNVRPAM